MSTRIIDRQDDDYPDLLSEIADPPERVFVVGSLPDPALPLLAVVGSRQMTSYGARMARQFTAGLVAAGFGIVSGLMYGIDTIAHETALLAAGTTIGVLGSGFDHIYPARQRPLAQRIIASGGCVVSEYPPGQHPCADFFRRRNRIVAGMCLGVLVIEAQSRSGTKITARHAAEQGREVFVLPSPIGSPCADGAKDLVNLGAKLVTTVKDIIEEL